MPGDVAGTDRKADGAGGLTGSPRKRRSPIASFLLAVTIPALLVGIFVGSMPLSSGADRWALYFFASAFVISWLVIAAASIAIGLPLTALLVKLRVEAAWIYPSVGFLAGIAFWLIFFPSKYSTPVIGTMILGGLPGAFCGWLWWRFARRDAAARSTRQ